MAEILKRRGEQYKKWCFVGKILTKETITSYLQIHQHI